METDTSAFGASLSACGCQKMLHTSLCLSSWLRCGGRKRPLGAQQREPVPSPLFKCNNRDVALDLRSMSWAGRVLTERLATWGRGGEEKKSQEWKRIEKKQVRWMLMHVHPAVRTHPDWHLYKTKSRVYDSSGPRNTPRTPISDQAKRLGFSLSNHHQLRLLKYLAVKKWKCNYKM